jgi:hypothetical protein
MIGAKQGAFTDMNETNSGNILQKTCVFWSSRRERDIALRVHYDFREQDGCKIYGITLVEEVG